MVADGACCRFVAMSCSSPANVAAAATVSATAAVTHYVHHHGIRKSGINAEKMDIKKVEIEDSM